MRGEARVVPGDLNGTGEPAWLRSGDVALMRGPDSYTVAGDPTTAPLVVIQPGPRCTTLDGQELRTR
jgi:hypothetical protein